jgi:hypothetical protein
MISKSTTPFTCSTHDSSEQIINKRNYKLIPSTKQQIYQTTSDRNQNLNRNQTNEQFTQLTLSQLELLEHYDPMVSAKIGVPFIPVQMLARPKDAQQSTKRSIQQIEKDYPKYLHKDILFLFDFVCLEKMVNLYLNHVHLVLHII